ncbi:MAG: bis(5'-nucleosyl)-tetraphosphatase [Candidatus Micrarchaeota archaeon]|nr:bis(5'-nucleosyl)-tetraphosphatase [Candidatus Micrarchaeota archaeon]
MAEPEKSCGAVVFRNQGGMPLYLLLHHKDGHWDFPKGHVVRGETEKETVMREVFEETGIRKLEFSPSFRKTISYKFIKGGSVVKKEVVFLLAKTDESEVRLSHEHGGFDWLLYEEALSRITYANSRGVLRAAHSEIF